MKDSMKSARESGFQSCHICELLAPLEASNCERCGAKIHARIPYSIQRTMAYSITAAMLALPAHLLPVMTTTTLGNSNPNTILGGVLKLWSLGSLPIAIIIFLFSVVVPLFKLSALFWLCWAATYGRDNHERADRRVLLYRLTEMIGPWSMLDIFVVAVLVALIQITGVMVITPGWATICFGLMVISTMLGAESFDPRLIWDKAKYR